MLFKKILIGHVFFFVSPLKHLFWTSGDIWPGFQSQAGSPCLCALSSYNGFLRFTSDAKPADHLVANIVINLFRSIYSCTLRNIGGAEVCVCHRVCVSYLAFPYLDYW